MLYFLKYFISILLFFIHTYSFSQELPPITFYPPNHYNAENQNWAISQANDKNIFIANSKGLLEFNGAKWQLYPSPNETIIRSVKVIDDKIFTGCYMEFGYWERNNLGLLDYTSLTEKFNIELKEDEQFWNIIELDSWVLFQSLNRIYIFNRTDNSIKFIESKTTITKIFSIGKSIFFQKMYDGLYKIENGKDILVSDDKIIKKNIIVNIFKNRDVLLIETQEEGFYELKNKVLNYWNISANELISKVTVYNSIQLRNGSFMLGTISKGIILLSPEGDLIYQVDQNNGLGNNTVLSLFEDIENNIWLGLDKGINSIEMRSPFTVFKDNRGDLGTIYTSIIFENSLYLGTNQGLFFRKLNSTSNFKMIDGTQGQVWHLTELDDKLFCGHNIGTLLIDGDKIEKISDIQGTWNIKPISGRKELLLQGNYDGLNILEKNNNKWKFKNKIKGFDISSRYFEILPNQEIIVNHEYKGVFKIKTDIDFTEASMISIDSLRKGLYSSLLMYNNDLLYAYREGIFKYSLSEKEFIKDTSLSKVYNIKNYTSGKLIADQETNILWSFSKTDIKYLTPGKLSNTPVINSIAIPDELREGVIGYENILHLDDQKYLLGTSTGYIIINLDLIQNRKYHLYINSIEVNSLKKKSILVDKTQVGDFKNKENNIDFTFSVSEYDKYLVTEYQYQLVGIYDDWSDLSTNHKVTFKNLPFGDYIFNVRARVGNTITENIESYYFKINRPFFLSNLAIVLYVLFFIILLLLIHAMYSRYYKKQRKKILEKTERKLALEKLENTKQKIEYKNENLKQDIENKNRELAISTMSLIKKNEFLNNIKNELKKVEKNIDLKSVIHTIDSNLNNTDDWNLFEKAFNNADKDFLYKVKQKHQLMTPNDLRLCAYLRLNLSSKEIAPLLNITIRSVEIRRYRLRKKISLSREINLNDYFMNL